MYSTRLYILSKCPFVITLLAIYVWAGNHTGFEVSIVVSYKAVVDPGF